ncbi:hypothetical protein GCM10011609_55670 [Lentzea pudingi]|uniref:Uncharacterized protein n=1 Tax=Lentzea pudingi TaxID=1789439 RepID=A0ABQ2IH66_9PSEU|nr:hypothetical protein GCM10011609_55670 [Lentzea pudingi]
MGPHRRRTQTTQPAAAQRNRRAIYLRVAWTPDQIAGGLGAEPPGEARNSNQAARNSNRPPGRVPHGNYYPQTRLTAP